MDTLKQSERLEKELESLRDAYVDCKLESETARMLAISKVIIQYEKELSKQKILEGKTLEREALLIMVDELIATTVKVGREHIPKHIYDAFMDSLIAELGSLWSI